MPVTFDGKINTTYPKTTPRINKRQNLQNAATTAGGWFAFGVGLDYAGRKCQVFKSPTKNSILINGILATGAGLWALIPKKNT